MDDVPTIRAALNRMRANLRRRLTEDEKESIDAYANLIEPVPGFVMNRLLRSQAQRPGTPRHVVEAARRYIPLLDSAMTKAYSFPNDYVHVVYRGVSRVEVSGWKVGSVRTFKAFMSTSFIPAHSFLYQKCCILVIRGSPGAAAQFVYSPNEEELVLDRGTKLRLKSVRQVKTTPAFFKHPKIAIEEHPPFGGMVSLYEAVIVLSPP
jgi:hypothetical protein